MLKTVVVYRCGRVTGTSTMTAPSHLSIIVDQVTPEIKHRIVIGICVLMLSFCRMFVCHIMPP